MHLIISIHLHITSEIAGAAIQRFLEKRLLFWVPGASYPFLHILDKDGPDGPGGKALQVIHRVADTRGFNLQVEELTCEVLLNCDRVDSQALGSNAAKMPAEEDFRTSDLLQLGFEGPAGWVLGDVVGFLEPCELANMTGFDADLLGADVD
jgi:uncharacterized protein YihD (DUF1040 family)